MIRTYSRHTLFQLITAVMVLTLFTTSLVIASPTANERHKLELYAECSPNPNVYRVWRVKNVTNKQIDFTWEVVGHRENGKSSVGPQGETYFNTQAQQPAPNTVQIRIKGKLADVKVSNDVPCDSGIPATATHTPIPTNTPSPVPTNTNTPTNTPSLTPTNTNTPTNTPSLTPTNTNTPTNTPSLTPTNTNTPTNTPSLTPTNTNTPTNTPSLTPTNTNTPTNTPSLTPTNTNTPTNTPSLTPTNTSTPTNTPTFTPTPISPECNYNIPAADVYGTTGLINAILSANRNSDTDIICLTPSSVYQVTGVYNSQNGLPQITTPIIIKGFNATITRFSKANFRLFEVNSSGNLTLESITLQGGYASIGGAILLQGTVTINNSTIINNRADNGGGAIYNERGSLTVTDSTVNSNIASIGGGLYSFANTAITDINTSTFNGNTASDVGGGIFNLDGRITLKSSELAGNQSAVGGGLHNSVFGIVSITTSNIHSNRGDLFGGGVSTYSAYLTIHGSCLVNNTSADGDEVYNSTVVFIDVTGNWWGQATGPAVGDLSGIFTSSPFLTSAPAACP